MNNMNSVARIPEFVTTCKQFKFCQYLLRAYIVDRSRSRQVRKPLSKEQKDAEARVALKSISELTKSPKSDGGKKPDLRARYWKFLFDNLQRAVDAIYETCEQDESALECRVCIMGGLRDLL